MRQHKYTTILRAIFGAHNSTAVRIVSGNLPVYMHGSGWHYRTRGGTVIQHPYSYSKRGWSNMVYHHANREIVVGSEWLAGHMPEVFGQYVARKLRGEL